MLPNNKTLLDFQKQWEIVCDKGCTQYDTLTPDERIWFNVQSLIGEAVNGGLISFYFNYAGNHSHDTVEDLIKLGFPNIADILKQIHNLFPNGQPSTDIDERNDVIDSWEAHEHTDLLLALDEQFYAVESDLENALVRHVENKVVKTNLPFSRWQSFIRIVSSTLCKLTGLTHSKTNTGE